MADDDSNSSSSSSSSSSEDDFLTINKAAGGGGEDREALVRKKLLESFYGKSAVAAATPSSFDVVSSADGSFLDTDDDYDDDDYDHGAAGGGGGGKSSGRGGGGGRRGGDSEDLDSPSFNARAHTQRHVMHSSVRTLLETEERLSLQVRTLDSTMQTLVYENYSRFIDATDAIRSIGVNVQANEDGLSRLTQSMHSLDANSREVENSLGTLRDQVAEKIRVKRLLTRLDLLLKLPETLVGQIQRGNYREATKTYLSASSILGKHSEGFESLKTIETECRDILDKMKVDLRRKLLHWSGRSMTTMLTTPSSNDDDEAALEASTAGVIPEAPKNVSEIFECSGTLFILLQETSKNNDLKEGGDYEEQKEGGDDQPLSAEDLQSLSTSASVRLLDRLLDAHMIEVQERRFAGPTPTLMDASTRSYASIPPQQQPQSATPESRGAALIPCDAVEGILDAATLYGATFGSSCGSSADDEADEDHHRQAASGNDLLQEFISEAYSTFLMHVRAVLLEESANQEALAEEVGISDGVAAATVAGSAGTGGDVNAEGGQEEDAETAGQKEISAALAVLLTSVRDLASGLTESGVSVDYAASLVDQVMQLTESMVRRRVDSKFIHLRQSVVQNCIIPFVERVVAERREALTAGKPALRAIVPIGSSTLSDCLQLCDDSIRSTLAGGSTDAIDPATAAAVDLPILKEAVSNSTFRFAAWLASALEILAGGESSDPARVVDAPLLAPDGFEEDSTNLVGGEVHPTSSSVLLVSEDMGDYSAENSAVLDLIDRAHRDLLCADGSETARNSVDSDFVLCVAEMCRLAQASVSENLDQSITTHLGGSKKKQPKSLFPSGESSPGEGPQEDAAAAADETTKLFQMAFSRLVMLFATSRGSGAGELLCLSLDADCEEGDFEVYGPDSTTCAALEIVKHTAIECSGLYGGSKRAGPIPTMDFDALPSLSSTILSRNKTGLQLDVERIFKERITIYPHASDVLEPSRNNILFVLLKVAFRGLLEQVRMSKLSVVSFLQLQVNVEFLKLMVPHYISEDFSPPPGGHNACTSLLNLLDDVLLNAEERCVDEIESEELRHQARENVRNFMADIEDNAEQSNKYIIEED